MSFFQDPPRLGNQFSEDRALRSHLERVHPDPRAGTALAMDEPLSV